MALVPPTRLRNNVISSFLSVSEVPCLLTYVNRLPGVGSLQALGVVGDDLAEDFIEANGDFPVGIVRLELGKIRDVADVIALAVFPNVPPVQLLPGHLLSRVPRITRNLLILHLSNVFSSFHESKT